MSILNIADAKFAWANNEALLINNKDRKGWEAFNASEWTLDVFEKFEFQLKPASIQVGGQKVEISQPLRSLADLEKDQIVYVPNLIDLDTPMSFFNTSGNEYRLNQYLKQNLLHTVESMAVAHAYALVELTGGVIDTKDDTAPVEPQEEVTPPAVLKEEKTPRTRRTKKEMADERKAKELHGHFDVIMDSLKTCKNEIEVCKVCYKLENYGFTPKAIKELEDARDAKLAEITQIKQEAETSEFDLKESTEPTDNIVSIKDAVKKSDGYQDKLDHLIECVWNAQTEVQANAILRYTAGWTADQINPLQDEIDKRIAKIKQDTAEPTPEKPSMIVQILNAADETELDALEIDVAGLDPFIQSEMKKYIDQRRDELAAAAQGKG
ncbi:hypothetical protein [Acinetobacter dispersus]|uniref:Uncharacterized protein n=1 Tax=Acinetobacter dispersus TaxID=70348 RepID=N9LAN0_9GAMM|nr:hypothetical protein [Acinetobacter dispersus]ENW93343.1 hypothetical protein F904_01467 [Acinetobacter dispersus]